MRLLVTGSRFFVSVAHVCPLLRPSADSYAAPVSGHSNQQPSKDLNGEDFLDECKRVAHIDHQTRLTDLLADLITIDDVIIDTVSLHLQGCT